MSTKRSSKQAFKWDSGKLREVDKSLYCLLQLVYDLKLISKPVFHHGTTCETELLTPIEGIE